MPLAADEPREPARPHEPAPDQQSAARVEEIAIEPIDADLGLRVQAGLADVAFIALVAAGTTVSLMVSGIVLSTTTLGGVLVFVLDFSFLYLLLPLAFWGRTPGMAWAGVRAIALDGGLLTFRRCAVRWFVGVLTVATGGLLALVALIGRRSLADRLSGSRLVLADTE